MEVDRVGAGTAHDDVGTAAAIEGVRAGAAGDDIGARRADKADRRRGCARVDVDEVRDRRAAGHLIGVGQIHVCSHRHVQRAGAAAAADGRLCSVIIDQIGAAAAIDDIGAAIAIDRFRAGPSGDRIGARAADDSDRVGVLARVDVEEVLERRRTRRRLVGRIGEVDVDARERDERVGAARTAIERDFRTVEIHEVETGAADNHVASAVAVDGFRAGSAGDRIGPGRTGYRQRAAHRRRVDVHEILEGRGARCRLIGDIGEIEIDSGIEHQRVRAGGAAVDQALAAVIIDGVGAIAADDNVRAAAAVDGLVARTAGNRVRDRRAENRDG